MEIKNVPTYHCGYCSKYYIRKYHAGRHEKFCKHNPQNKHACFELCEHLEMSTNTETRGLRFKEFRCKKLNKMLYSFKAEKSAIKHFSETYAENGILIERMPLDCTHYSVVYQDCKDFDF